MVAPKNIIKKVQIGVNTPSLAHGMQLKDNLTDYFKNEIFPELDNYFNSIQNNKVNVSRYNKISIEINIKEEDSLIVLKQLIINKLKEKISDKNTVDVKSENIQNTTAEKSMRSAFFYYLKYGILPWWSEDELAFDNDFFENIKRKKSFRKKLELLLTNPEIRKRLIYQFNDKQLTHLIFESNHSEVLKTLSTKILQKYRRVFWESVLHYSAFRNDKNIVVLFNSIPFSVAEKLVNTFNEILDSNISIDRESFQKMQPTKKKNNDPAATINDQIEGAEVLKADSEKDIVPEINSEINNIISDGILIKNAGLILLHPFLKMFFEKMEFLSEKHIKPDKIDEAIHTLHYLATGQIQPFEHQLIIEKFLCNVPINYPVNRHIYLTQDQMQASRILLEAVLNHWTALKSNSVEILQNEFLQRDGKLTISKEKRNLYIQRKTQDLLLDKLPWNLHLVKLPWIEKILFVEW
ncbi:contractile injection system tape measure protein [Aequorivita flava]|uniref:Contractile injection system tape measure protein n=1 Tax=Aequorivita flava TaxID=3114371 RepID=A0AB35YNX6_9FLAO